MIVGILACMAAAPSPLTVIAALLGAILVASWPPWDALAGAHRGVWRLTAAVPWKATLIGGATLLVLAAMLLPVLNKVKGGGNRSDCKNNLKQLGLGLILYRDNQGLGAAYPAHDGDDFLIALWDAGVIQEPDMFLCPSSGDDNAEGAGLRLGRTAADACSYAGRRNRVQSVYPGLFTDRGAANRATACDDLEGTAIFNHEDAVIVLFADGHVEEIPVSDPRIATEFGNGGLLDPLAD